jgi:hypothetical protein
MCYLLLHARVHVYTNIEYIHRTGQHQDLKFEECAFGYFKLVTFLHPLAVSVIIIGLSESHCFNQDALKSCGDRYYLATCVDLSRGAHSV